MDPLADWLVTAGTTLARLVRTRLAPPWGMKIDSRGQVVLHVVAAGSCWVRATSTTPRRLLQGDLVVLPHGDGHELADERDTPAEALESVLARRRAPAGAPATTLVCGIYSLDGQIARPMLRALPKVVLLPAERIRVHPELGAILSLLIGEVERPEPGAELLLRHLFESLFVYLVRAWLAETGDAPAGWLSALRDVPITRALSEMHARPGKEWSVEALARVAGLSRAAFARRFAEALGEPPLTYLGRWRMGLAARLLVESDATLAEVAARVGYDSEFAFSRAFKRIRGVAPSVFRQAAHA